MTARHWHAELWRLCAFVVPAAAAGMLLGYAAWGAVAGLTALACWHAVRAVQVLGWLSKEGGRKQPPVIDGIWGEIVDRIERQRVRERKRRKRLTGMLERFQRSTEALPDGTVVLGPQLQVEWANSAARSLLGIDNPRDQGIRIRHLLRDPHFQEYLRSAPEGESVDIVSPVDARTELNVRVIPYGDGQYLLMARDVSNLRRLETVRRDFVANVSHELRTPLTVIRGYAETSSDEELPGHVHDGIEAIARQAARMQAIVEDLLALSRLELDPVDPDSAEWVTVSDLLAGLVRDGERLSGERCHVLTVEADSALGLKGAANELASAFGNLINNAVQHTPAGTRISVRWQADDGGAVMAVEDDGPGIDEEHLPRITERFYRVDPGRSRARGGTGLGLALVKHAVARNGGRLDVASTPGEGSRFSCHFPAERVVDLAEQLNDGQERVAD